MAKEFHGRFVLLCDGANIAACIAQNAGASVTDCLPIPLIGGFYCRCSSTGEKRLRSNPDVVAVDKDFTVNLIRPWKLSTPLNRADSVPTGVSLVRAPAAWQQTRGAGASVAILDTGIDLRHPDLAANLRGGVNLVDNGGSPQDDHGHGTHVAGIVAARDNGLGLVGVAPHAGLYAVKVLNQFGSGTLLSIILGLQWVAERRIPLANMSLGLSSNVAALERAVRNATAAGVTIVAAAGNEGRADSVAYPAKYADTLAVSAITDSGSLAGFSSYGPEIDLAAPGVRILSTLPGGRYGVLTGTSMASPHAAGVAALYLALHPGAGPDQVRDALKDTAVLLPGLTDAQQGAGRVDALNAVKGQREPAPDPVPNPSPQEPPEDAEDTSGDDASDEDLSA